MPIPQSEPKKIVIAALAHWFLLFQKVFQGSCCECERVIIDY